MKKLLIIYPSMMVGGSTTSLLSILNELDYSTYQVDLLLFSTKGKLFNLIPSQVNILPFAITNCSRKKFKIKKALSIRSIINLLRAKYYDVQTGNTNVRSQIMQKDSLRFSRKLEKEYDVAISFLEGWPLYYLADSVKAKRKIAWIHLDYLEAGLNPEFDRSSLQKMDKIILVSEYCKNHFDAVFPEYESKSIVVENILSQSIIQQRSKEVISYELPYEKEKKEKFVTVCRVVLHHKGLDRGIRALKRLQDEGILKSSFAWYIIGTGQDEGILDSMIKEMGLSNYVFLCGEHINPLPIEKKCHVFFLPSHYEGKPMAVTESQMLGLLPVVTNYSSASEQIVSGENGIVIPNVDEEIYVFLKKYMLSEINLLELKNNVTKYEYSNLNVFEKVIDLIEGN